MPCCTGKCVPAAISDGADIFEVPGSLLLRQMSSQSGSRFYLKGLWSHELTAYFVDFEFLLTQ